MALNADDIAIGDLLVQRRVLTLAQLDEATSLALKWELRLVHVIMACSLVQPQQLYQALAQHFDLELINLIAVPPERELLDQKFAEDYSQRLMMPWRRRNGRIVIATAQPGPDTLLYARSRWGNNIEFVIASKSDILWEIQRAFRELYSQQAVYELAEIDPEMSARRVTTPRQLIALFIGFSIFCVGMAFAPIATLIAVNALLTIFYLGNFIFKGLLVWVGGRAPARRALSLGVAARLLRDEELPIYTILVPMFREPEVLPILAQALRRMDYPLGKLDIKLVLEEHDHETIDAARALALEGVFEIICVPQSHPQTKPKACNYALKFARGDFLVIYDAEDKPEPDQLRMVVAAFQNAPAHTACIQCRLNYYNAAENWLTRMFTLDYALWFDLMLPGLERLGLPIPLGGTSNHFRIDVLRQLHAWDPFNVTEDADLGIRLTQKGYRVGVIDSTTYEEANCSTGNWIRQRSRWIKGYMQTFLVHSRRPISFVRDHGPLAALGFVFFIGGTMLSGLLNPIFWGIFLIWLVTETSGFGVVFPPAILCLSLFNLLLGNGLLIYLTIIAPFRRSWLYLAPYGLTVLWYWVLTSIAAFKALWQLIVNPFYWEKTQHGISKFTAGELASAKNAEASMKP